MHFLYYECFLSSSGQWLLVDDPFWVELLQPLLLYSSELVYKICDISIIMIGRSKPNLEHFIVWIIIKYNQKLHVFYMNSSSWSLQFPWHQSIMFIFVSIKNSKYFKSSHKKILISNKKAPSQLDICPSHHHLIIYVVLGFPNCHSFWMSQ